MPAEYYPYSIQSRLPRFKTTSPGEMLWLTLRDFYTSSHGATFPEKNLFELSAWVEPTSGLAHYYADLTISSGFYKLLMAAKVIEKKYKLSGNFLNSHEGEQLFLRGISTYMVEYMGFGALDQSAHRLIPPIVLRSHLATRSTINATSRNATLEDAQEASRDENIRCYCCHSVLWGTYMDTTKTGISLDHIWPLSLGGLSSVENLLPVCNTCNGAKEDRESWSIFGVISDHALASRGGARTDLLLSLALHRRAATKLATENYLSLKESYLRLGPLEPLNFRDPDAGSHFFNMQAHDTTQLKSLW